MKLVGLLMAGGRSERMRASAGPRHKALVEIAGMTLIERNLRQMLGSGLREVIVALAADEPELDAYVRAELVPYARARGATLTSLVETAPLGNIGAVGWIGAEADEVLVVYVDNLTGLDLRALVDHHLRTRSALTIAAHREGFAIPHGLLELENGRVRSYREKPVLKVPISSGTCVVGAQARRLVPAGARLDACDFFALVDRAGLDVAAYEHDAPWVDVNDRAAILRAEELVARHPTLFPGPLRPAMRTVS